jgi:hypothetical protein
VARLEQAESPIVIDWAWIVSNGVVLTDSEWVVGDTEAFCRRKVVSVSPVIRTEQTYDKARRLYVNLKGLTQAYCR